MRSSGYWFYLIGYLIFFSLFQVEKTQAELTVHEPVRAALEQDLELILNRAQFPNLIVRLGQLNRSQTHSERIGQIEVNCFNTSPFSQTNQADQSTEAHIVELNITGDPSEWSSAFYWGLHRLGFLFPHPRRQINPAPDQLLKSCDQRWIWKPRFKQRGFHLHTEHPNEWVKGFLQGEEAIATDLIRWLARNQQNIFEIVLLRTVPKKDLSNFLKIPFQLAHELGIATGVSVSLEMQQQKSAHLANPIPLIIPFLDQFFSETALRIKLHQISRSIHEYFTTNPIDFDFLSADLGTTEFSNTSPESALAMMEEARRSLALKNKPLFIKVHASMNQFDLKYGNFNFLPKFADPSIGILPHTLMFYGLSDESAPMYGRKDFSDMLAFMRDQAPLRPTWYYPETSYWIGLDQDIPLLLTDYLLARSTDMDLAEAAGIPGHLTFTSGQGLGYWLFDWTVALLSSSDYSGDPLIGLKLLGEDEAVWKQELAFQNRFFKKQQLISALSSENPMDELPSPLQQSVLRRNTLSQLNKNGVLLESEIALLEQASKEAPHPAGVRNHELRSLLEVTHLRINHALTVRNALLNRQTIEKEMVLNQAAALREAAHLIVQHLINSSDPYPSAGTFARPLTNPTSYDFGYLWPASSLYYWKREEDMIRREVFDNPFFENIFNIFSIIF